MRFLLPLSSVMIASSLFSLSHASSLELIGTTQFQFPLSYQDTQVGGLSAIDYDPKKDEYYAQSDDRSERSPARFYRFQLKYTNKDVSAPELKDVTLLKGTNNQPYNKQEVDPESFRVLPDRKTIIWGSEGNIRPEQYSEAAIRISNLEDGKEQVVIPLPPQIKTEGYSDNHGLRYNLAFESLTLDAVNPSKRAWTASEGALLQDGDGPSPTKETPVRLYELDLERKVFARQFVYMLDRVPEGVEKSRGYRDNGLVDLLDLNPSTFLSVERAFIEGKGYNIRVYEVNFQEATDVAGCMALTNGCVYTPTKKTLIANFTGKLPSGVDVENLEGVTWGKPLSDGTKTLVFIADNNFAEKQIPQIAVFKYLP